MPYPTPHNRGFLVKLFFNLGKKGWAEDYHWAGDDSAWEGVEWDTAYLVDARLDLLTERACLLGVRVTPFQDPGLSGHPLVPTKLLAGPTTSGRGRAPEVPALSMPPWTCGTVVIYDRGYVHRAERKFAGMSSRDLEWSPSGATGFSPVGAAHAQRVVALLGNNDPPGDNLRGRWAILGTTKDPALNGRAPILLLDPSPNLCFSEIVTAQTPIWKSGDIVYVSLPAACGLRGMAGRARVLSVDGLRTTVTQIPACCGNPVDLGPRPTICLETRGMYPHAAASLGRVAVREVGARFRPSSWAPAGVADVAVHPCGVVLDFLRFSYLAEMRTFSGPDSTAVYWFPAEDGAMVFEAPTIFRSRMYDARYQNYSLSGEEMQVCWHLRFHQDRVTCPELKAHDGCSPVTYQGTGFCGDLATWERGALPGEVPAIRTDLNGAAGCCPGVLPIPNRWCCPGEDDDLPSCPGDDGGAG